MTVPGAGGRGLRRPLSGFAPVQEEPSGEPRYVIAAVAAHVGVHVRTVRRYEAFGLVEPTTDAGGVRLYSEADIERARRVRRLVDDLGVNLAGAAAILHLRDQLIDLQREIGHLRQRR